MTLTREQNERLTRVGPGTPMGELMRRYWHPIAATEQLKQTPVRQVRLLGEDLVLYRDHEGTLGLLDDRCAHRRVKLRYGVPERNGLRCPYHGWLYDATGQCIEQPAEPDTSAFKDKVRLKAYPVQELAGLIFGYLGPAPAPQLPRWDRLVWDNVFRTINMFVVPANWLQCMEDTLDTMHVEWLHGRYASWFLKQQQWPAGDIAWKLAENYRRRVVRHDYEIFEHGIIRRRVMEGGSESDDLWTIGHPFVFPNIFSTSGNGRHNFGWRVPIDDENMLQVSLRTYRPQSSLRLPKQESIPCWEPEVIDASGDVIGAHNHNEQDVLMWTGRERIADRSLDQMGDSDRGILLLWKLLLEQLERSGRGEDPMNVFRQPHKQIGLPAAGQFFSSSLRYTEDGSYRRGSVTAGETMPEHIREQVEDLFARATEAESAGG
jgi:5,5'-dehydrodivanillate O-demethylase oxygenase subunit